MSDLQQWLGALFGHWQHWLGGAIAGAGVLLAVALVQRLFRQRLAWPQSVTIFVFFFGADVSYLAWRDQYALMRSPVVQAKARTAAATLPPALPDVPSEARFARKDAEALASDIQAFAASREMSQPRPPHGTNPAAAELKQFGQIRDSYNLETLDEFKASFSARLAEVLDKLNRAGIDTVEIQAVLKGISQPTDVKDIAVRLNALSKE